MDIKDFADYSPEDNKGYRFIPESIDNSSSFGRTIPLKSNSSHTKTGSNGSRLFSSERKTNLFKTDDGKDIVDKLFYDFLGFKTWEDNVDFVPKIQNLPEDSEGPLDVSLKNSILRERTQTGKMKEIQLQTNVIVQNVLQKS